MQSFACKVSFQRGHMGNISFLSKSKLIDHYESLSLVYNNYKYHLIRIPTNKKDNNIVENNINDVFNNNIDDIEKDEKLIQKYINHFINDIQILLHDRVRTVLKVNFKSKDKSEANLYQAAEMSILLKVSRELVFK